MSYIPPKYSYGDTVTILVGKWAGTWGTVVGSTGLGGGSYTYHVAPNLAPKGHCNAYPDWEVGDPE